MPDGAGQAKRRSARVPFTETVTINDYLRVQGIDLSEGGLFVHTGRNMIAGAEVAVSFVINYERVDARAMVQFSEDSVGMGLMFINLDPHARQLIKGYIQKNMAPGGKEPLKQSVFVLADTEVAAKMFKSEFVRGGFSVFTALDEQGTMRALAGVMKLHAVILALDVERPGGLDFLRRFSHAPLLKGIPVIVLSNSAKPDTMKQALAAGATDFMQRLTASPKKVLEFTVERLKKKG